MKLDAIAAALAHYEVVLEPDENVPEWWAGAPSVARGPDGILYLAARMREGNSPKGKRGYEVRILESRDGGRRFEPIHRIPREAAGVAGFERPALVVDPASGKFKLYGCAGVTNGWGVLKWDDADHPALFDPKTVRPVLTGQKSEEGFACVTGYKDPFVFWDRDRWRMFALGYDNIERIYHFESGDGEAWRPAAEGPVMENTGWHNFYMRPACVVPLPVGYLFVYEGSHVSWRDPVYNIATGLAYSPDLIRFIDLTPDAPLLRSTTPGDYHTWRYSHWLPDGPRWLIYFEAARPNNTNEIRMAELDFKGHNA